MTDDGSRDNTGDVARAHGGDHVVRLPVHRGLAATFPSGFRALNREAAIRNHVVSTYTYTLELTERRLERVRRIELELGVAPSHHETGASSGQTVRR